MTMTDVMTDVVFYDNNNGGWYRVGKKLCFQHSGFGNLLPKGFTYKLDTLYIKLDQSAYKYKVIGSVEVEGWSEFVVINNLKDDLIKINEQLTELQNVVNKLKDKL
jgi:hypothetical protein